MIRTRQPSGIAVVDPSYPYARNLRGAWISGQSGLLQNASKLGGLGDLTAVGAPTVIATPYGLGVQLNGSSQYLTNTSNAAITQFPFTLFLLVYMSTGQTGSSRIFDISQGTGNSQVAGIRHEDGTGYRAQVYDGGNSQTNASNKAKGTWNSFAGRFSSASERSLFVNGALLDTNSETRSALSGIERITIGFALWGAEYLNGIVVAPLAFDAALPDAEIAALASNPYRWVKQQRRLWIQLGAAAGGTTTEATLSATVTASLLGSRAISVTRSAASATGAATTRAISTIKSATTTASSVLARAVAKIVSAASATGAATTRAISTIKSATTTASSVLARAVAKIVSAATTTVATIANQVTSGAQTFYRELTAATAAGALALRQSNLTRSTTAAASALTLRAVGALRVATQTATATQTSIKVKLKELAATGVAASAALTRAVATTRLASAVLSASATLRVGVYLSVAASAVATRLAAVAHTFSVATATAAATVTTLKVKLKNLATDVVSTTATLTRQTLAQRVATLAGTATAQRAISSTLAATQPVTAVAVKAISKTLAVAASALATLVRQLLSGSFWSADRTYTIAAAPRTYTISAAAPRIYTV